MKLKLAKQQLIKANSYFINIGLNNKKLSQFQDMSEKYKNFEILKSDIKKPFRWLEIENDKFRIFLHGYFYFSNGNSTDPEENLLLFLEMLKRNSEEEVLKKIGGGLYNLFLFDKKNNFLTVHNDRLGLLPLYYLKNDHQLMFTNNQMNFYDLDSVSEVAIIEFLKFGYLPTGNSFFNNVKRMCSSEIMKINLKSLSIFKKRTPLPDYPNKDNRLNNSSETLQSWNMVFARYFGRYQKKDVMAGLSGGYDSRLITAFLKDENPYLLNFGDKNSAETKIAKKISAAYDLKLNNEQFPDNSFQLYADKVSELLNVPVSLENVHVMHLSKKIQDQNPEVYFDGFLGDVIFGDTYYALKSKSVKGLYNFVFNKTDHEKLAVKDYVDYFYNHDKEVVSDSILKGIIENHHENVIKDHYLEIIEQEYDSCKTHEDLLERISLITRGRNLIGIGPQSIMTHTQVALPFVDNAVLDLSIKTSKKLRSVNSLYNKFFRNLFPVLATIRKAGTYGKASDSDLFYRLKMLAFVINKSMIKPLIDKLFKSKKQQEEEYFSNSIYLRNPENKQYISNLMSEFPVGIPEKIHEVILNNYKNGTVNEKLLIRYITLLSYMKEN